MSGAVTSYRALMAITLGASAGGVEALMTILPALGPDCGVPVFVVLHLPRERPSLLVEIFRPKCSLPVAEAQDKQPIEPGTIYFAPPDYHLLIDEGPQLALSSDELVHYSRPSLDVLFESVAEHYGPGAVCVLLGEGGAEESDGRRGAQRVRARGGLVIVQNPQTAVVGDPRVSDPLIGGADTVLHLSEIAPFVSRLGALELT